MAVKKSFKEEKPVFSKAVSVTQTKQKKKQNHAAKKEVVLKKPTKSLKVSSKNLNYSICIPTSITDDCKNLEQTTNVIYHIAKTATIFNVGEVIILDLGKETPIEVTEDIKGTKGETKKRLSRPMLIATLLQYFVTPPYLVNTVFKKDYHKYFKYACKLPRLSVLPFMRYYEEDKGRFREGLAVRMSKPEATNSNQSNSKKAKEFKQTKYINIGKSECLELKSQLVPVNVRVTVDTVEKRVVAPQEAYGDYVGAQSSFGYHVRVCKKFGSVFTESAFPEGYSQAIWCNSGDYYYNEKLKKNDSIENELPRIQSIVKSEKKTSENGDETPAAQMSNLLVLYGKWKHILESFEASKEMFEGCSGPHEFFDGQLELPGAAPRGMIPISDCCTISLTLLSTM
ncbi:hypothetical protein TPHA_0A05640 [Tetrapisispora phaffii CBS 4417]|uniref:Uncharacterized protein n=1 Tax=Tetrapisispora phaffii (strain ATCC 24235 / CBS 4417 / NBRC 1672 / NRRL Y-8282 / UCD 70-5) TaxID=1071381 RepID=G8BP10_TETPH|nr:hypothetical protein TPHA_0A05640 [Tetrapisispora phaffii CBS 4417]CCE61638.1 hypothetical protein TPHA_0A05640 [Tetrapisispora phaffii CBS 4417]